MDTLALRNFLNSTVSFYCCMTKLNTQDWRFSDNIYVQELLLKNITWDTVITKYIQNPSEIPIFYGKSYLWKLCCYQNFVECHCKSSGKFTMNKKV